MIEADLGFNCLAKVERSWIHGVMILRIYPGRPRDRECIDWKVLDF